MAIAALSIGLALVPRFDNGGRYNASHLDDMDVIYENLNDNYAFREGYSTSIACPWGFQHLGIDFFLKNDSKVLAATSGIVYYTGIENYSSGSDIKHFVRMNIQFNLTIRIHYTFEVDTTSMTDIDHQLRLFEVQQGDWVVKGQEIARFLNIGGMGDHIDFGVLQGSDRVCPQPFYSAQGYTNIMQLVHAYNATWNLCYS